MWTYVHHQLPTVSSYIYLMMDHRVQRLKSTFYITNYISIHTNKYFNT